MNQTTAKRGRGRPPKTPVDNTETQAEPTDHRVENIQSNAKKEATARKRNATVLERFLKIVNNVKVIEVKRTPSATKNKFVVRHSSL
jgi:hypothetical protein